MSDTCPDCGQLIFAREAHFCEDDARNPQYRGPSRPEPSSRPANYDPLPNSDGVEKRISEVVREAISRAHAMHYLDGIQYAITQGCLEVLSILRETRL